MTDQLREAAQRMVDAFDGWHDPDDRLGVMEDAIPDLRAALDATPHAVDVERLAEAIHEYGGMCRSRYGKRTCVSADHGVMAEAIAAEYARLGDTR
jgi:hypothetical protein